MKNCKTSIERGSARGASGQNQSTSDLRDLRGGTFDDHHRAGGRQGEQVSEKRTPHEEAQWGADVRSEPVLPESEPLPAGLEHREGPMNKSTGRHKLDPKPDE
jgi:hypothetical protein